MLYLLLIPIVAVAVWRNTTPETATRIGLVVLGLTAVCWSIAIPTGNWLLAYLGAILWPTGALLLLFRMTTVLWRRRADRA